MSQPESKKRNLEESETALDDSIASIRAELLADKQPSMRDIAILLIRLIDRTESTRAMADDAYEKAKLVEHKCEQLHRRATEIENTSETHQQKIKTFENKTDKHEASLNKIEQQKVDNDVFISGFPVKPDHKKVASKITEIYGIRPEMIADSYQFEFKAKKNTENGPSANSTLKKKETEYHHVVISFKERNAKFEFMKKKRENNGPLFYEQIDESLNNDRLKKSVIRCSHRLTRFNLAVQSQLLKAKNENKLLTFQLHNGLFRLKKDENSKWIVIDTETSLNAFAKK